MEFKMGIGEARGTKIDVRRPPEDSGALFGCLECSDAFWEPSRVEKVANMAPTWVPRWKLNPSKIMKNLC